MSVAVLRRTNKYRGYTPAFHKRRIIERIVGFSKQKVIYECLFTSHIWKFNIRCFDFLVVVLNWGNNIIWVLQFVGKTSHFLWSVDKHIYTEQDYDHFDVSFVSSLILYDYLSPHLGLWCQDLHLIYRNAIISPQDAEFLSYENDICDLW